jgi:intergrase/recombinase
MRCAMRPDSLACVSMTYDTRSSRLLEAGEPDHVVESITGHLSRRMLEHYPHMRLNAKKAALDRLGESAKAGSIKATR